MAKKASRYERESNRALETLLPIASTNAELRKRAGYSPRATEPRLGLDVTFVTRAKMKSLNKKFRGKDYATDVLSFPALEIFARQGHLGDLVICEPILEAQAKELGHTPLEELHVLLVHGLLHLLGYDHEISKKEAGAMAKWEGKLLAAARVAIKAVTKSPAKPVRKSTKNAKISTKAGLIARTLGVKAPLSKREIAKRPFKKAPTVRRARKESARRSA